MPDTGYIVANAQQLRGYKIRRRAYGIIGITLAENSHPDTDSSIPTSNPTGPKRSGSSRVRFAERDQVRTFTRPVSLAFCSNHITKQARREQPLLPQSDVASQPSKLYITSAQLSQAIMALARSPVVNSSLQRQHLRYKVSADDAKGARLYSMPNKQFAQRQTDLAAPILHALTGSEGGVAVFDSRSEHQPLMYSSALGASDAAKIGDHANMTLPDGPATATRLVIRSNGLCQIMVQVVCSASSQQNPTRECYVSVEKDVTGSFLKATISELVRILAVSRDDLCIDHDTVSYDVQDDWIILTDRALAECQSAEAIDTALKAFRLLDARSCDMQTLALMTELAAIRTCYQDFVIIDLSEAEHDLPAKVRFISRGRAQTIFCDAARARRFVRKVVSVICAREYKNKVVISADGSLECVPLKDDRQGLPRIWAVFTSPLADGIPDSWF